MLERLFGLFSKKQFSSIESSALHLQKESISHPALTIIRKLKRSGWDAFIVGGAVRDLLLNVKPKDFDIVTNASPHEIKSLFRRSRIIGRRFRIVHVYIGNETIEVSTFRKPNVSSSLDSYGRILRDNVFGSIEDDVKRRDLTINSLYYDPVSERILDYHDGISDLQKREIVVIGKTKVRLIEDPLRIVRIIRIAAKLDLIIPLKLKNVMRSSGILLENIPKARLSDDLLKMFVSGKSLQGFNYILELGLDKHIFPNLDLFSSEKKKGHTNLKKDGFIYSALKNLDFTVNNNRTISISFIFAVLFWEKISRLKMSYVEQGFSDYVGMQRAISETIQVINQHFYFQRKHIAGVRELCLLQGRFNKFLGKSPFSLIRHARFYSAFKLLELRVKLNEVKIETVVWWGKFHKCTDSEKVHMINVMRGKTGQRRSYKKRRGKKLSTTKIEKL
ncbi:polynucleotide adenylyltransferase PcnB [Betaproteobacteria bacterium]|nr:polynucleotide adenylyltransferase PcnB [Betaproteobacteria bacterium]